MALSTIFDFQIFYFEPFDPSLRSALTFFDDVYLMRNKKKRFNYCFLQDEKEVISFC